MPGSASSLVFIHQSHKELRVSDWLFDGGGGGLGVSLIVSWQLLSKFNCFIVLLLLCLMINHRNR